MVAALIKTFFTSKNGKPNKILEKMGPDVLSGLLQNTFKNKKSFHHIPHFLTNHSAASVIHLKEVP